MHQYELNSWSKMNIDQMIQSQQLQLISEDLRNFHFPRPTCTASDQQRPCSSTPSMTMMHLRWNLGIWGGNMVGLMIVLTIFMNEKSHLNLYVLRVFIHKYSSDSNHYAKASHSQFWPMRSVSVSTHVLINAHLDPFPKRPAEPIPSYN